MNKTVIASILTLAFVAGFLFLYKSKSVLNSTQNSFSVQEISQKWESKTDKQEGVTIVVTPLDLLADSEEWIFDVALDTHSVELDQDMVEVAILINDQGEEYKPLRWEGAPAGGHHREGILIFEAIDPVPSRLELKIRKFAEIPESSFEWDLI